MELTISSPGVGVTGLSLAGEDWGEEATGRGGRARCVGDDARGRRVLLPDPNVIPGTLPADGGVQGKAEMEGSGTLTGPRGATLGTLRVGAMRR